MCRCMLRCSLPLPLLWFMLSTRTSGCGILNGIQTDAFSEILSVGINIETLKNESQDGLASQASFTVDTGGHLSGGCIGKANSLKRDAKFIRADSGPSMVQARTLLQPKVKFGQGKHDVDEGDDGLPVIVNGTAPRVFAWSPTKHDVDEGDDGLPVIVNGTAPRVFAWSPNQSLNQLAASVNTVAKLVHKRLGVHWWAWLALAIGASFCCFFASTATTGLYTQRREVHSAQAANAGKHIHGGRTQPLKQSHPPSLSCSLPLPPLPLHSTQAPLFAAPFSQLASTSVPHSQAALFPKSSSSIMMQRQDSDAGLFLCPQLVVPTNCECSLRLNLKPARMTPAVITDVDGNTVMHVSIHGSASSQAASLCNARRVLLTTEGSGILAQCKNSELVDGEFHLLREDGQLFGKLWQTATESCGPDGKEYRIYKMRSVTGAEWHFGGILPQLTLDVTDATGGLLALSRPEADSPEMPSQRSFDADCHVSWVKVTSNVDVSIVLCAFLAISNLM
mmetsp:Transcript_101545/g.201687  ORF Transcript_101545/g.201687 Transcript_101545/m.201687 type:complete len:506 (+) Transcript_101545:93-1610(+)